MRRGFVQFVILAFIAVVLFSAGFYYQKSTLDTDQTIQVASREDVESSSDVSGVEPTPVSEVVVTGEPLVGPVFSDPAEDPGALSVSGILDWTNIHRENNGLPSLTLDLQLSAAANIKVQDMFNQQYFAHDAPNGDGPSDLADQVYYEFIMVGENLALGNYENDEDLVQAWMDSPGHRANILNDRYTEIGIAVLQGTFEGDQVWMAVQEFALPISACPAPSDFLYDTIESNEQKLSELDVELQERWEELENTEQKYGVGYNKKVNDYNTLVGTYNDLVEETKALVDEYNAEVQIFNTCASS